MEPIRHRDAAEHGLTADQLRGPWFVHPTNGVAVPLEFAHDLASTCAAVTAMVSGSVVTHLTAGHLRGWWLPSLDPVPIVISTDGDAPHHDRRGVYVRRCAIPPAHRRTLSGVPTASPEWTIVELAEHLSLIDLVVAIDSALSFEHTSLERIRATMVKGRRGVRVLRRAVELADHRSESPWESVNRLAHVLSGIPVEPQSEIRNAAGVLLMRLDLRIRGTNRAHEYDGAVHRDLETHRRDLRRDRLALRLGIERIGYTAVDLTQHADEVIREAVEALGLPSGARTAALFTAELEKSSFRRTGHHALVRRLARFDRVTSSRRVARR